MNRIIKSHSWAPACVVVLLLVTTRGYGATISVLSRRGYTVIPEPQSVTLTGRNFRFDSRWRLELGPNVSPADVAVKSLTEGLYSRFGMALGGLGAGKAGGGTLRLSVAPNSVSIGSAADRNKDALAEQAYKMSLDSDQVAIRANTRTGLFYGVQTFLQLLRSQGGALWLPEGQIVDWPDLELRVMLWDDGYHLERMEAFKAALREAACYKINGFMLKLQGHFQYQSAPAIVEPYALSPAQYQEITNYALRYHIQVISYMDGPAHDFTILKHPQYIPLREYPRSNYEFCVTNPETYKVFFGLYQDLLDATKGAKYFMTSNDEPYFIGWAKNAECDELDRANELGGRGKLEAEFIAKTAGYVHDRGRTVLFWGGEVPLKSDDISSLPGYLISAELPRDPEMNIAYKAHGIREMIQTLTEGLEPLFPAYYMLPASERLHPAGKTLHAPGGPGRVQKMFDLISYTSAREEADLMGVVVAGWRDAGVHYATFWLGYVTGLAAAWHPGSPDPEELMSTFYRLFYGPTAIDIGRVYQLMSTQAEFWEDSWDRAPSAARKPIFGGRFGVFNPPRLAQDQTLPPLPVPSLPLLRVGYDWSQLNARRLQLAGHFLAENDELLDLLQENLQRSEFHHYNLHVFLAIARLCRQNLEMLLHMREIDEQLKTAQAEAGQNDPARALAALDQALDIAERIWQDRNRTLHNTVEVWYKTWEPRVAEANGRKFLFEVDDVKDSPPVRTVDMSYLIYRELLYPLGKWADEVEAVRNHYAGVHHLSGRRRGFHWEDYKTLHTPKLLPPRG